MSAAPRHDWLYAISGGVMPESVACAGRTWRHVTTFKHDFFAATGLYTDEQGAQAVLKVGRQNRALGLPLRWIGRWLTRRESFLYQLLHDLGGVPRFIGNVGDTGLLHAFVPGHPLGRDEAVSERFFAELQELLRALHGRGVAYVDLNKRQNILMGEDGRPYLIDFQISLYLPRRGWRGVPPLPWVLARFQRADEYHALKHKRRLRPDLLTEEERRRVERVSIWIRLHRLIFRPLIQVRRMVLRRLARSETVEVAGSKAK